MKHNVIAYNGKGKIGNMVGYTRGGVQMFRAWQPIVANPRTARQVLSRAKLAVASDLARGLSNLLRVSYGDEANSRVSARNLFTKQIIPASADVIAGQTPEALAVKYENLPVARGVVENVAWDEPDLENPVNVKVAFTPRQVPEVYTGPSGEVMAAVVVLVIYNKALNQTQFAYVDLYTGSDWAPSSGYQFDVMVPSHWQGTQVEMYGFVKQVPIGKNGIPTLSAPYRIPGRTSNSQYLGVGTIA